MRATAETDREPRATWSPSQFVLLPENRSAVLALRRLGRRLGPHRSAFVLLLHGPPGTGKSHLADDLLEWAAPRVAVVRRDAADWAVGDEADLGEARGCDLLIVEDLQHLPARAAGAFAALLDHRAARGLTTLLTASRGPAELENLSARLASRLSGGLIVGLRPLGLASRRRFLKQRAAARHVALRPDVLDWLARQTPGSGRQLLAALEQVRALAATLPAPPEVAAVRAYLEGQLAGRRLTVEGITERVGFAFRVEPKLIRGRDRQPGILWPRQVSMYLARAMTPMSLAQIGSYFGRDHTTVRHACQKVADVMAADIEAAGRVRELEAELVG